MRWLVMVLALVCVSACSWMSGTSLFSSGENIGVVEIAVGEPRVFRDGGNFIVEAGVPLRVKDTLITGPLDRIKLKMVDGTRITLGANSEFVFHVYSYARPAPIARMSFSQGAFRIQTDKFPQREGARFEVTTPFANIHFKSADLWGGDLFQDNQLDVVLLNNGEVTVLNAFGQAVIVKARHGTTVNFGAAPIEPERWPPEEITEVKLSTSLEEH